MLTSRAWALGVALLLASCGEEPESVWTGTHTCSVGIPPVGVSEQIAPFQGPLDTDVSDTANGFPLRDFTLGPIGGFSCQAREADATFATEGSTDQGLTRGITVGPFDCIAPDGRTYTLTGAGAAGVDAAYFSLTFSPWLDQGQAIVVCTITLRRQAAPVPDAGVPAQPVADAAPPEPLL